MKASTTFRCIPSPIPETSTQRRGLSDRKAGHGRANAAKHFTVPVTMHRPEALLSKTTFLT